MIKLLGGVAEHIVYRLFLSRVRSHTYALTSEEVTAATVWLADSHKGSGLKAYFKMRDYAVLKEMAQGLSQEAYWMMIGRRKELLHLMGTAKSEFDKEEKQKKIPIKK